jgi:hypothetical protein
MRYPHRVTAASTRNQASLTAAAAVSDAVEALGAVAVLLLE